MRQEPIHLQELQIQRAQQEKKKPAPFSQKKEEKKSPLPQELQTHSLDALRQLLAQQKGADGMIAISSTEKLGPSIQVMELFEKLVTAMTHIDEKGIQETTFFLDAKAHNSSLFAGSKITITEYSTAPKLFNITIETDQKAQELLESHMGSLYSAFEERHFSFGVHRVDTYLRTQDKEQKIEPVEEKQDEEA